MYTRTGWVAGLLTTIVAAALTAGGASAQGNYSDAPTDPPVWGPLNPHLTDGGLFLGAEYVMYRQTNPLKPQVLGSSGFTVTLPNAVQNVNGVGNALVGQFIGSGATVQGGARGAHSHALKRKGRRKRDESSAGKPAPDPRGRGGRVDLRV